MTYSDAAPMWDGAARRVSVRERCWRLSRHSTLGWRSGGERLGHSAEVIENPRDDGRLLDAPNHAKLAAAAVAGFDVDGEDALEPLSRAPACPWLASLRCSDVDECRRPTRLGLGANLYERERFAHGVGGPRSSRRLRAVIKDNLPA